MSDHTDDAELRALRRRAESILDKGVDPAAERLSAGDDLTHELHVAHQELVLQTHALGAAEGRLRDALAQSDALFAQAPCALLWIDDALQITRANRRAVELFGEVERSELLAALHPAERASARRFLEHVVADWESSMTVRILRPASVLTCLLRAVRFEARGERSVLAFVEPMDGYVKLADRGNLLEAAINQSTQGVIITTADLEGDGPTILYVNDAMCRMSGRSREALIGRAPRLMQGPATEADERARIRQALRDRAPVRARLTNYRPDGAVYITDLRINPIFDARGRVQNFVSTQTDVTRELREARSREHAQRLEAVGTLAGGVAHDFNNLLTVMHTLAELGREDADDPGIAELFDDILGAAQRASALTRRLLTFSRNDAAPAQLVDIREMLDDIAGVARRLVPESIELRVEHDEGTAHVLLNPIHLEQIVLNLVTNARDAIGDGPGRIALEWRRSDGSEAQPPLDPGAYLRIDAVDDGPGVPAALRSTLFDPFVSSKPAHQGTGLGLAVVRDIAQRHGGGTALGPADAPTRVSVFLPVEQRPGLAEGAAPPRHGSAADRSLTAVVVEDDPAVRDATQRALAARGHTVHSFADPRHGLAFLEANGADVLVTDVVMPAMSGVELADRARVIDPGLGVLFVSGYVGAEMRDRPLRANERFLPKPFSSSDLIDAVIALAR